MAVNKNHLCSIEAHSNRFKFCKFVLNFKDVDIFIQSDFMNAGAEELDGERKLKELNCR
jgi:hypothetical protein